MNKTIRNIKCKKCESTFEYEVFDSVNVTLMPNLKEKVIDDCLFIAVCPNCGQIYYLSYDFIYNDMDCRYMIYYSSEENNKKSITKFENMVNDAVIEMKQNHIESNYKFRFVTNIEKMKEKIRIFDRELDDRIIELYKYEIIANGYDKELNQLLDIVFVNFDESSQCVFILYERDTVDNVRTILFDEMEYIRLEKEYEYYLKKYNHVVIDLLWAQNVYNNVNINS